MDAQAVPIHLSARNLTARVHTISPGVDMIQESMVSLFKSLPVSVEGKRIPAQDVIKETVRHGFLFSQEVAYIYTDAELLALIKTVSQTVGLTPRQMNASFHKSWGKVKNAPTIQLVIEQLVHYMTTYGYENYGLGYHEDVVYIPHEKLNIPELGRDIKLTVIHGLTPAVAKQKLMTMLGSGIALDEDTIDDIMFVARYAGVGANDIDLIKNNEVRTIMYDITGKIPESPVEFLRLLIHKIIDNTMIIKNNDTIDSIKEINEKDGLLVMALFGRYDLSRLSQIFYRYKPLFLAMRSSYHVRPYINKLRRLARKNHKPMKPDYLNDVTAMLKRFGRVDLDKLNKALDSVNLFRKVRLAYALKFRTTGCESITYRVRNGKSYSTSFSFENSADAGLILDIVRASIVADMAKNVKGVKIYIPDNINYTLPSTQKMFSGEIPSGSYISVRNDAIVGIHWENVDHHRVDLDLSMISLDGKLGWDSSYRNTDKTVLFSGDVTDAPVSRGGASELFYIGNVRTTFSVMLNMYSKGSCDGDIPYKIIVASEHVSNLDKDYTVDPNNVIAIIPAKIDNGQTMLGIVDATDEDTRFYFAEFKMSKSITSSDNEYSEHARDYIKNYYRDTIGLRDVLTSSGAVMVKDPSEADVNLSLESIEKSKIIALMTG